jgi:predicted RNase H-like HicB family nuclease
MRGSIAMQYHLAVEDIEPNYYVAWVVDLPGCFSAAATEHEAIAAAPDQIQRYFRWVVDHDRTLPRQSSDFTTHVVETSRAHPSVSDPTYLVNACFTSDHDPMSYWDMSIALRLLAWSRQDLIGALHTTAAPQHVQMIPGLTRSVTDRVAHLATAEQWYLSTIDRAPDPQTLPQQPYDCLVQVRRHAREQLAACIGDARAVVRSEETWTVRKVVRRMLWHERSHTEQILGMLR